jgi:NADPH:quinone reductase-like Zn-dependent oxidoreductase
VVSGGLGLAKGTRVAFRTPGTWAERVAVPIERTFAVPDDVSDDDAAQLPLNPLTAYGLLDVAGVRAGDWVGLTAPRSSVARLVEVLAATRGVRTLPIETAGLADEVRARTGGEGLAALLDSVGGPVMERLFGALRPGATVVAYGTASIDPISVRNATLIYANLTWRGFGIDHWYAGVDPESRARMLDELLEAMRRGRLPLPVRARVPLSDFRGALRWALDRGPGKVLLA